MHIDHIAIRTNDLEKEKEFFLKYFDCTVNEKYENRVRQFSSYFIEFSGGARIELMKQPGNLPSPTEKLQGLTHFAVNVGNREMVDVMTEKFEDDGILVIGKPRITGDGYYESIILDPENNQIELFSF